MIEKNGDRNDSWVEDLDKNSDLSLEMADKSNLGSLSKKEGNMRKYIMTLSRLHLLPITVDQVTGQILFKYFSWRTLQSILLAGFQFDGYTIFIIIDLALNYEVKFNSMVETNVVDLLAILLIFIANHVNPIYYIKTAQSCSLIEMECPGLWPVGKHLTIVLIPVLGSLGTVFSFMPMHINHLSRYGDNGRRLFTIIEMVFISMQAVQAFVITMACLVPLMGWCHSFVKQCESVSTVEPKDNIKARLELKEAVEILIRRYNIIERILSTVSFFIFCQGQILLIFCGYSAIGKFVEEDLSKNIEVFGGTHLFALTVFGLVIYTVNACLLIFIITETCIEVSQAFQGLAEPLAKARSTSNSIADSADLENIIRGIQSRGPISAKGFFTVERSTITSIVSTTVTYLIILIQFKQASI